MPPVDPNISPEALKSLDDFKKRMEEINDQIVDMGNELGDDLVKKLTKVTISAKIANFESLPMVGWVYFLEIIAIVVFD